MARRVQTGGWFLVWADRQSAGRGRQDRDWISDTGGLYYTLRYPRDAFDAPAPLQTVGAAALWVRLLREVAGQAPHFAVKWPNDLLCGGRKLGGLLGESDGGALLLGIGVNVNNTLSNGEAFRHPPVSLREATGDAYSRRGLLMEWLRRWMRAADAPDHGGLFAPDRLEEDVSTLGKRVRTGRTEGRACGLAQDGGLILQTDAGPETVYAGDVVEVPYA